MRVPRLLPSALVIAQLLAMLAMVATAGPATAAIGYPAGVTGGSLDTNGRLSNPTLSSCDVDRPAQQFVTFPSYAQTAAEICGIRALEDAASTAYDELHGRTGADQGVVDAVYLEAGYVFSMLRELAADVADGRKGELTADQKAAYAWYLAVQQHYQQTAAADAQREYQKWAQRLCDYRPPNTKTFTYNPTNQPVCSPGGNLSALFTTLAPPTYANFVMYGRYDADQELGQAQPVSEQPNWTMIDNGIIAGAGALGAVFLGAMPTILESFGVGGSAMVSFVKAVYPHSFDINYGSKAVQNAIGRANVLEQSAELEAGGAEIPAELESTASTIAEEAGEASGISFESAAEGAAGSLAGPIAIVTIAVTLAVMQGVNVFTAANIPHQLAADIAAADPADTDTFITGLMNSGDGVGATMVYANYRSQLRFPAPTIGVGVGVGVRPRRPGTAVVLPPGSCHDVVGLPGLRRLRLRPGLGGQRPRPAGTSPRSTRTARRAPGRRLPRPRRPSTPGGWVPRTAPPAYRR